MKTLEGFVENLILGLILISLRSKLSKVKDKLPSDQNSNVYRVPCSYGKFYISGMMRRLETRLKEHKEACLRGEQEKSCVC